MVVNEVLSVEPIPSVMSAFLTLCVRAAEYYHASTFVSQILAVLGQHERTPVGRRDTTIPSRIAGLIHTFCGAIATAANSDRAIHASHPGPVGRYGRSTERCPSDQRNLQGR